MHFAVCIMNFAHYLTKNDDNMGSSRWLHCMTNEKQQLIDVANVSNRYFYICIFIFFFNIVMKLYLTRKTWYF